MALPQPYVPPDVRLGLRRTDAIDANTYGTIAYRDNPNNYNSIESRDHPDLFGQFGATNPAYQQSSANFLTPRTPSFNGGTLRRPASNAGFSPWQISQYQSYMGQMTNGQNDDDEGGTPSGY
jgi:hypothetical protein